MVSSQVLQKTLDELKNITKVDLSILNLDGPYLIGRVAVSQIQNLIIAYKERLDKNNFIQNLLLDNLLLVDIYNRAKKLRIETNSRRIVFMVETATEKIPERRKR